MFGLFFLEDRNGLVHVMSAKTIYKKIMKDSQNSDYNWIATAEELNSICNQKNFPQKYAVEIKVAILNCYAKLINKHEIDVYGKSEGFRIACIIYNSLSRHKEEKVIKSRSIFLKSVINRTEWDTYEFLFKSGETFWKISDEWAKQKFNELFYKEQIDFSVLHENLSKDFIETIKKAESEGVFEVDRKKEEDKIGRIIQQSVDDFIESYGTLDNPKKRKRSI